MVDGADSGSIRVPEFIEPVQSSIENLNNISIADPSRFRQRIRINGAEARDPLGTKNDEVILERLTGETDDLLPFYVLELGSKLGCAVCKVHINDEDAGTGFLVGPDVLLTNAHVLPDPATARAARCMFDFQLGLDRLPRQTVLVEMDPDSLFLTSPARGGFDYTFVRIDRSAAERFGLIPLSRGSFTNIEGEFANIIQHPGGGRKSVAFRDNRIVSHRSPVSIRYTTDTDGGSSGAPVFNSDWQLIGLHHAAVRVSSEMIETDPSLGGYRYLNEAIKLSAIASDLERRASETADAQAAAEVLRCFHDTDSLLGYFGTLGREAGEGSVLESVVSRYQGEADDVDVGFWNVEWFSNRYKAKSEEVTRIIAELQLDVYALIESSPEATRHLVEVLKSQYGLDFGWAASEPNAPSSKQSTTVIWNKTTIDGERIAWPEDVEEWFRVDSRNFDDIQFEAVHGKVFDRYPGLFRFSAKNRPADAPFDFNLVPLHLKAMAEGALRRRMASEILAAAVSRTSKTGDDDWVIGGDINAELMTGDFEKLTKDLLAVSASDEAEGAMTYLKSPKSMIDHIFVSPNLARHYGAKDFFLVAPDTTTLDYVQKISDHRPVLMRMSLGRPQAEPQKAEPIPGGLAEALAMLRKPAA